ncbi:hypothetical protein SAMN05421595_1656 [Austwickia chelonae]|uniref:GNAT family N-acetyltransferase n=1 Tax=Austwickia chelonae TaxID=100225 RepID=UPI0008B84525|nr:GNAT family N-acetyltransferase [Austwickia chelonae]SEW26236.1 hypothetical protein SAMN05421595_1656 [Austwickia chelonae]
MRPFAVRSVRPVGESDRAAALELCGRDPLANCYVTARMDEVNLDRARGALLGHYPRGRLEALCWATANVIPVECGPQDAAAFGDRLRRHQHRYSSVFGPSAQVSLLWEGLSHSWQEPLDVRPHQPLLAIGPEDPLGMAPDTRVRPARLEELTEVVPAAAAMFTEEIGYPPYQDRAGEAAYRYAVQGLVVRKHCFVLVEDGRVVFKADIGSVGLGVAQIQGVWVAPDRRGEGLAAPAMARVVQLTRAEAPWVSLYVNDFNKAALRAYARVGFRQVGEFATILF